MISEVSKTKRTWKPEEGRRRYLNWSSLGKVWGTAKGRKSATRPRWIEMTRGEDGTDDVTSFSLAAMVQRGR